MKTHEHAEQMAYALRQVTRHNCDFERMTDENAKAMRNARAVLISWDKHNAPPQAPQCRQTACRFCGLDIEGLAPFRRGEWRDRGNNTTCPDRDAAGNKAKHAGKKHAPTP